MITEYDILKWVEKVMAELDSYLEGDEHICPIVVGQWIDELFNPQLEGHSIVVGGIRVPEDVPTIKEALNLIESKW